MKQVNTETTGVKGTGVLTDPIADMLTRIRNAAQARHANVKVPVSKMKREIAKSFTKRATFVGSNWWVRAKCCVSG